MRLAAFTWDECGRKSTRTETLSDGWASLMSPLAVPESRFLHLLGKRGRHGPGSEEAKQEQGAEEADKLPPVELVACIVTGR
jgi:hypothetical protein